MDRSENGAIGSPERCRPPWWPPNGVGPDCSVGCGVHTGAADVQACARGSSAGAHEVNGSSNRRSVRKPPNERVSASGADSATGVAAAGGTGACGAGGTCGVTTGAIAVSAAAAEITGCPSGGVSGLSGSW